MPVLNFGSRMRVVCVALLALVSILAGAAMSLSSVSVITNALRLRNVRL